MIPAIFVFLLKSALCSGLFLGYYLLVLKQQKMHRFNRWYLLLSNCVSLALPLVKIDLFSVSQAQATAFPILQVYDAGTAEAESISGQSSSLDAWTAATYAYIAISGIMLLVLTAGIVRVYTLKRRFEIVTHQELRLVMTDLPAAPFSFMNLLFWNRRIETDSMEGKAIMDHERVHIRERHTLDKLFMQLVVCCCWPNPVCWLIRKELGLQHEFLADEAITRNGDTEAFARMLLQASFTQTPLPLVNLFFHSSIKRRLMMLTTTTSRYAMLRRILVLPLLAAAVLLFSFTVNDADVRRAEKTITVVLDAAHGGKDAGGKSLSGLKEKDIALRICRKITALAPAYNIAIVPTRTGDDYPSLQERIDLSNRTRADLFISIHLNKSTPEDPRGNEYELGVSKRNGSYTQSLALASAIVPRLQTAGLAARLVDQKSIVVLSENKHPALLIECGNLDDEANMAFLGDDARLEQLCRSILSGIVDYGASR